MGERDDARREVEQKREHMTRIAHEVSRRMTPRYAKERAREMAQERMSRVRDRAVESSWFAPLLGAAVGALVAKTLQSRAQERGWGRDRYYGFEGRSYAYPQGGYAYAAVDEEVDEYGAAPGVREEPAGGAGEETRSTLREKASDVKERARETAEQVKGRIEEATSSMRERLPGRERIRESAREDAGLWALGAMALGALFGFALPESEREREMLAPARRRARELTGEAKETAARKGSELMEKATEKVGAAGGEQREQVQPTAGASPPPGSPAPLH